MLGKRAKRGVSGRDGSPSRPSVPAVGTQGRKTARIHRSDLSRPPFCHFRPKNTLLRVLQEGAPSFHGIILGQRFPDAGMTTSSSRLDDPLMPASRWPDAGMIFASCRHTGCPVSGQLFGGRGRGRFLSIPVAGRAGAGERPPPFLEADGFESPEGDWNPCKRFSVFWGGGACIRGGKYGTLYFPFAGKGEKCHSVPVRTGWEAGRVSRKGCRNG